MNGIHVSDIIGYPYFDVLCAEHEEDFCAAGYTPNPCGDGWFTYPSENSYPGEESADEDGNLSFRPHIFRAHLGLHKLCIRRGCTEIQDQGGMHPTEYSDCEGYSNPVYSE